MNRKRIKKKLTKLIDEIEFFAFDLCSLRDKTSLVSDVEDLTLVIGRCMEASHALRDARDPNSRRLPYLPNLRGPGGAADYGIAFNSMKIDDILLTRYNLLSLYYRAKRGEIFGSYSILEACKEITLPDTLKIPSDLTGDALITHLLDLINYTSKILYSEIKGD